MVQKCFEANNVAKPESTPVAHISKQFQIGDLPALCFLDGKHDKDTCGHANKSKQFFRDHGNVTLALTMSIDRNQLPSVNLDLVTETAQAIPLSA